MGKLVKNELIKIFKKKGIYIALLIVFLCLAFINGMNRFADGRRDDSHVETINYLKESLAKYNPDNPADTSTYIQLKTSLDEYELMDKYGVGSWQESIIPQEMEEILTEMNTYQYGMNKNEETYQKIKQEYEKIVEKLDKGDWRYFAETKVAELNSRIEEAEREKTAAIDKMQIQQMQGKIADLQIEKQVLDWRLEKNLPYGQSDKENQLRRYKRSESMAQEYERNPSQDQETKLEYQSNRELASVAKYEIENNLQVSNYDTRGMIINFFQEGSIFIIALIVMIAGTIISEEFNKGTVKLLLIKPYPRWKIILSKFITCMISMLVIVFIILAMQLVMGGIFYGFDSLQVPAIYYNFGTNQIETMNLIPYWLLQGVCILPAFVLVILIALMLGSLLRIHLLPLLLLY